MEALEHGHPVEDGKGKDSELRTTSSEWCGSDTRSRKVGKHIQLCVLFQSESEVNTN